MQRIIIVVPIFLFTVASGVYPEVRTSPNYISCVSFPGCVVSLQRDQLVPMYEQKNSFAIYHDNALTPVTMELINNSNG
jgi:hypothetical protein